MYNNIWSFLFLFLFLNLWEDPKVTEREAELPYETIAPRLHRDNSLASFEHLGVVVLVFSCFS